MTSVKVNKDTIAKLMRLIQSTLPNDLRGMVVIKDNKIIFEEYFNTYWRETIHDIRSAGKSVASLLLGIAIDKGLTNTEQRTPNHDWIRSWISQETLKMRRYESFVTP